MSGVSSGHRLFFVSRACHAFVRLLVVEVLSALKSVLVAHLLDLGALLQRGAYLLKAWLAHWRLVVHLLAFRRIQWLLRSRLGTTTTHSVPLCTMRCTKRNHLKGSSKGSGAWIIKRPAVLYSAQHGRRSPGTMTNGLASPRLMCLATFCVAALLHGSVGGARRKKCGVRSGRNV